MIIRVLAPAPPHDPASTRLLGARTPRAPRAPPAPAAPAPPDPEYPSPTATASAQPPPAVPPPPEPPARGPHDHRKGRLLRGSFRAGFARCPGPAARRPGRAWCPLGRGGRRLARRVATRAGSAS